MTDHSELIERLQKARLFIADRMVEIPETLRDQAAAAIRDLIAERDALLTALHDVINRPKGVVPESAEPFYDAIRAMRKDTPQ